MKTKLLAAFLFLPACVIDPAGYLIGAPVGVTTALEPEIRVKVPGFGPYDPVSAALDPFDMLLDPARGIFAGTVITEPESPIHAMSMGLEVLYVTTPPNPLAPSDWVGETAPSTPILVAVLEVGGHGWTAIGFTVDAAALGSDPLGGDVQTTPIDELDRTVFNYFLPGSEIEAIPMESQSRIAMAPDALGLKSGDAIHGLDLHMALYHTDLADYGGLFTQRPLPDKQSVYFTLRPAFLTPSVITTLTGPSGWNVPVNAATIFVTKWTGAEWSKPQVYRTAAGLGLTYAHPTLAIDALAIDAAQPGTTGTSSANDDILFSLAGSTEFAVGPENQVLYAGPGTSGAPPRRVVVRRLPGYGSLGKQLGAGVALGDICTGDPVGRDQYQQDVMVLDDFFIGRRLKPVSPFGSSPMPSLGLAAAAYRVVHEYSRNVEVPRIRACMSWPRHREGAIGTAWVEWGWMKSFMVYPGPPGAVIALGSDQIDYVGEPLVYDIDLPTDGRLRRPGTQPALPGEQEQAYWVRWFLQVGSESYRSPIVALRY